MHSDVSVLFCYYKQTKTKGERKNMDINIDVSKRFSTFLTDWNYEQYLLLFGYVIGKSYHLELKIILKLL